MRRTLSLACSAWPSAAGARAGRRRRRPRLFDAASAPMSALTAVATPVPAPIPVPFYEAAWYFRADFAAGFGSQPSITTAGTPFGASSTIGLSPSWLSESFEPSFTGGVGVGYVWGPQFRTDLTVDLHSTMNADFTGTQTYRRAARSRCRTRPSSCRPSCSSTATTTSAPARRSRPTSAAASASPSISSPQQHRLPTTAAASNVSAGGRSTHIEFAGAAMAGLTYDINTFVSLDVGYRYLYIGGTDVDLCSTASTRTSRSAASTSTRSAPACAST